MRALIACVALVGCGNIGPGERGNGTPKSEARHDLTIFERVSIEGGPMRVDIGLGISQLVEISGDENIVPLIETTVTDKHLRVRPKKNISPKLPLVAKMTTVSIDALDVSGSTNAEVSGVTADTFAITTNGSSKVSATGRTKKLTIHISGSGTVDTKALVAEDVKIDVSGSAEVVAFASGVLDVTISGSGTIRYAGTPREIRKSISGSGSVEPAP